MTNDTIVAISTAAGAAAIGIIKISGSSSVEVASKIFKPSQKKSLLSQDSFSVHHGFIINEKNERVDEVLVNLMRGPKSYTAEDVVEINCHGGPVALRAVLGLVIDAGARLAEPGEFTKRAYINGRLDLAQAEAVTDIISAKTELALKTAQRQLEGRLSCVVNSIREEVIDILAQVTASFDFSDEDIDLVEHKELINKVHKIREEIGALYETFEEGNILKEGIKTAIIGGPNVGKSSLLNALLKKDRAIVTEIAGTTRDLIEEIINVNGLPLLLQDTAGIRKAFDEAEKKGIEISNKALDAADLVLLVVDSSKTMGRIEKELVKRAKEKKAIVVLNKNDVAQKIKAPDIKRLGFKCVVSTSALRSTGIKKLKEKIVDVCVEHQVEPEEVLITSARQARSLSEGNKCLERAQDLIRQQESEEIIAFELKRATDCLGQIIGEVSNEDILGHIFSKFCIGK